MSDSNSGNSKLSFGDRNGRILLVIGVLSVVFYLLNVLSQAMLNTFATLYVGVKIWGIESRFGFEHLTYTVLITSVIIIFFYCILYCYHEFFNFCNFENNELKRNFELKADEKYKLIIGISQIYIIISIVLLLFSFVIFLDINNIIKIFLLANNVIILIFVWEKILKKFKDNITHFIPNDYSKTTIFLPWILLCIILFLVGFGMSNESLKYSSSIKFSGTEIKISYFNAKPKEFEVNIQTPDDRITKVNSSIDDFHSVFSEVVESSSELSSYKPNTTGKIYYNQCKYEFTKNVDIAKFIQQGKNFVEIKFKTDRFPKGKKIYRIVNEVNVKNKEISYLKSNFDVGMD